MEIIGKIIKILPLQTGQGRNGEWRKQEFVLQTEGPYPKSVCFTAWGTVIDGGKITENAQVKVSFDPESREFNNKWYTDLKAWRVDVIEEGKKTTEENIPDENPHFDAEPSDDLPF